MPRTIALVFAHPDDETFATGGTLAKYSAEGVRIVLYSATDGGAGKTSGIPVSAERTLGNFRRDELAAACAVLGVEPPVIAAHGDGRLGEADPRVVIDEIVGFLREHTPDVVITFGPEGAPTGHRDHKAISQLVTTACRDAGVPKLCYVTWPDPAAGELYQILGTRVDISIDVSAIPATQAPGVSRTRLTAAASGGIRAVVDAARGALPRCAGQACPSGSHRPVRVIRGTTAQSELLDRTGQGQVILGDAAGVVR